VGKKIPGSEAPICPKDLVRLVREHVHGYGENSAMKRFGLTRMTLGRVLGELPVRAGTIALIRQEAANASP
jgi:hypothetical protein